MQNLKLPHERLKYIADYLHLTMKQVSEDTGISYNTITRYFAGSVIFREKFAKKIQDTYNISAEWLLTGEGLKFLQSTNLDEYNQQIDNALSKIEDMQTDLFELKTNLLNIKNSLNSTK